MRPASLHKHENASSRPTQTFPEFALASPQTPSYTTNLTPAPPVRAAPPLFPNPIPPHLNPGPPAPPRSASQNPLFFSKTARFLSKTPRFFPDFDQFRPPSPPCFCEIPLWRSQKRGFYQTTATAQAQQKQNEVTTQKSPSRHAPPPLPQPPRKLLPRRHVVGILRPHCCVEATSCITPRPASRLGLLAVRDVNPVWTGC